MAGEAATELAAELDLLWLFPKMAAVLHHAGAGTTGAGVPAVPVPTLGDQPFWPRRLAGLGVSPGHMPMSELSADRLADLIARAVTDRSHRVRARAFATRVDAEDGSGAIAQAVERVSADR
ncbi:glycosyltransferase [Actinokineospora iranica]|uniref:Erythromycin biosynthesis protein CIII-like C-terminal domain-containing protein n=1 Tax=Actinokineospora iranica TaxID=1271860 RepID=A0A1G6J290_9PSEU|nr:nucleotide disphospho-sugar-binding domain-containing protein [Actinokineospora iranica]SDC12770.1 hypothetical protein SAMN05216174_101199 [Actinokineospora iranica]